MVETDLLFLILSLGVLILGPFILYVARNMEGLLQGLDGFVFIVIGGMVLLHILPEVYHMAGWFSVLALILGVFGPGVIEKRLHSVAKSAHLVALISALIGVSLHSFTDGLALGQVGSLGATSDAHMLPMAVVLHRLPVGIIVWFLLRPVYGLSITWGVFSVIAVSTILGFIVGEISIGSLSHEFKGLFFSFVSGTLLHVVIHRQYPLVKEKNGQSKEKWYAGVGGVLGVIFVYFMLAGNLNSSVIEICIAFKRLAWESAPALLLAYAAAGMLYSFFPRTSLNWLSRGENLSQSVRGMAFGLPIPICSCGVVPIYRSLVAQGVPASAALSFMIATPELSIDALLITLPLLGGEFTVVRIFCAVILAIGIGWLFGRFATSSATLKEEASFDEKKGTALDRFRNGLRIGFGPIVDDTAPWILLGLSAAAVVKPVFSSLEYGEINLLLEVAIFALLGIPTYVCASGATPLAAVLVFNGISPGAALAFLLTGPATNLTTFSMLSSLHNQKVAISVAMGVTLSAIGLGYLVNVLFPNMNVPELQLHQHVDMSGINGISLLIILVVFLWSILRLGPRRFVEAASMKSGSTHISKEENCCDEEKIDCCGEQKIDCCE